MEKVNINPEKCKGCLLCVAVCPEKSLKQSGKINKSGYNYVICMDSKKCRSCGFCYLVCPDVAIEVCK